jgi:hypothetical protein
MKFELDELTMLRDVFCRVQVELNVAQKALDVLNKLDKMIADEQPKPIENSAGIQTNATVQS